MGREMGGSFKREGIYVYLWVIHVEFRQKTTKFCKAIILQKKKKKNSPHIITINFCILSIFIKRSLHKQIMFILLFFLTSALSLLHHHFIAVYTSNNRLLFVHESRALSLSLHAPSQSLYSPGPESRTAPTFSGQK